MAGGAHIFLAIKHSLCVIHGILVITNNGSCYSEWTNTRVVASRCGELPGGEASSRGKRGRMLSLPSSLEPGRSLALWAQWSWEWQQRSRESCGSPLMFSEHAQYQTSSRVCKADRIAYVPGCPRPQAGGFVGYPQIWVSMTLVTSLLLLIFFNFYFIWEWVGCEPWLLTYRSPYSPSTIWISGIESRSSTLVRETLPTEPSCRPHFFVS